MYLSIGGRQRAIGGRQRAIGGRQKAIGGRQRAIGGRQRAMAIGGRQRAIGGRQRVNRKLSLRTVIFLEGYRNRTFQKWYVEPLERPREEVRAVFRFCTLK